MSKFVKFNGKRQTKFDLAYLLMKLGKAYYVNPDHSTYTELVDYCIEKGITFDIK